MENKVEENHVESNGSEDSPDVFGLPFQCFGRKKKKKRKTRPKSRDKNTAPMVVDKGALFYKMDHKKRGIALIFNHENFNNGLNKRSGTNADRANLEATFHTLEFEVRTYNDLKVEELHSIIRKVSEEDHSDYDCFVMCVLSHGEENIVFGRDVAYKSSDLWKPFTADKCRTLAGKPKIFFIQACQGSELDGGISMTTQTDSASSYKIPVHADFLIAYSTIPGFFSWRNTTNGSWFVQALCAELRENGFKFDLLTILTFVNRRVATEFESNVPSDRRMHAQKQIPFITFMLTRLVKFQPKRLEH